MEEETMIYRIIKILTIGIVLLGLAFSFLNFFPKKIKASGHRGCGFDIMMGMYTCSVNGSECSNDRDCLHGAEV